MYISDSCNILPREKMAHQGVSTLSDRELLTLIIGSGNRHHQVPAIAQALEVLMDKSNGRSSPEEMEKIPGMGRVKSARITAAMEYARRRFCPAPNQVSFPRDVLPLVRHMTQKPQENFITLTLNGAHEVINLRIVSVGLVNRTVVHPREVYWGAITDRAAALVVCHNHPSGSVEPSQEDRNVTRRLSEAGEILGIPLLDHVIIGRKGFFSFLEEGLL